MKEANMKMSTALRKRFVKDRGLPIQVVQDPYFDYFIDLYTPLFPGLKDWVAYFEGCVGACGGEEGYFSTDKFLKNKVIDHIKSSPVFQAFNNSSLEEFEQHDQKKYNLYVPENNGKDFISIDLVKGNFRVLRLMAPGTFGHAETYEEFMGDFTPLHHFLSSKHIRQYIFGNVNTKKQIRVMKYIMSEIVKVLEKEFGPGMILGVSHDEIIIPGVPGDLLRVSEAIKDIEKRFFISSSYPLVRFDYFSLRKIGDYYVKAMRDGTIDFKSVPVCFMAQVYKRFLGLSVNPFDLAFINEGKLAVFAETLFEDAEKDYNTESLYKYIPSTQQWIKHGKYSFSRYLWHNEHM